MLGGLVLRRFGVGLLLACLTVPAFAQEKPNDPPKTEAKADKPKEPIAKDIKVEAIWDGRKMAPFKALDDPKMVTALEADFLDEGDYILGVTVGGESRAYPTRFVWFHHAINDTFGKPETGQTHVAITYCSVCNTGIRYDPVVNGKPIKLDFYGLYNGVVALCDRETESIILQGEGRAINGPLLGTTLKTGPLLDTTWGEWKKLHPDTLVMSPDSPYKRYYRPQGNPEPRGYERFPMPFFRMSLTRTDLRLPPFEKVLAITLAPEGDPTAASLRRAYPIKTLKEAGNVVNDMLDKTPVAVLLEPKTVTAIALSRRLNGKTLTLEARTHDGKIAFYDQETGTRWNIEGVGQEGPLAGKSLQRLDNHLSQWYGWFAYFPDTTIYGRTDPPQPGDPFAPPGESAKPTDSDKKDSKPEDKTAKP
ncbi:MAG TPA: DUF3179 domain-containing (seleno)protein [Chthonomonadaceae bacterium]|nr:DUF3179 domain-containing (seleno)protein [Chthonomonadaceae bacterium]